jgi:enoyl-CoA hydratase/carnithine racemase
VSRTETTGGVGALVAYTQNDRVAIVSLDLPERRNAWSAAMSQEFRAAMGRAERDPAVRSVVLTGAGKSFCVGADTAVLETLPSKGFSRAVPDPNTDALFGTDLGTFGFLTRMSKPIIVAMNGAAAGIGFVLSCFCDVRYAVEGAKLTVSMSRLGLPAEHGLSWILPRLIGVGPAMDLMLSSAVISAEEAVAIGLVKRALPREELMAAAIGHARMLSEEVSPASIRMMKQQVYTDIDRDLASSIAAATWNATTALTSHDFTEGLRALTEHRPPLFEDPT